MGMKKRKSKRIDTKPPDRNTFEAFRTLSHQIVLHAQHGLLRIDFLHETSKILLEFSGCDSIEMWLKERGKYYRSEVTHSQKRPFQFGIMPTKKSRDGKLILGLRIDSSLDQLCRDIVLGEFDPALPFFTKNGSFWTGDAENSIVFQSKKK